MRDRHGDQSYPAKDLQPPASKARPLLLPAMVHRLPHGSPGFRGYGIKGVGLVGVIVLSVVVAGLSMATQSKDLPGKFTQTRMDRETTEVPHGD